MDPTANMIRALWVGGDFPASLQPRDAAREDNRPAVFEWAGDVKTALDRIASQPWDATVIDVSCLPAPASSALRQISETIGVGEMILLLDSATPLEKIRDWINLIRRPRLLIKPFRVEELLVLFKRLTAWRQEAGLPRIFQTEVREAWVNQELERLTRLATIDPLTGLMRREELLRQAEDEVIRARRTGQKLVCIMGDIDHFKRINDVFGHQAGDRALARVAHLLNSARRPYDMVGRMGGEEFMIVMPGPLLEDGRLIAERLRRAVESHDWGRESLPVLTISFGVAELQQGGYESMAELSAGADAALYEAKHRGRNQVCDTEDARRCKEAERDGLAAGEGVDHRHHLLVIDDAPVYLAELNHLLGTRYNVDLCARPEDALAKIRERDYDLVISDLNMPGMQGHELLARIKAIQPQTMRILMSSHADLTSAIQAINEGEVYRYIMKPWHDEDLQLMIFQALEHRAMARRLRNADRETVKTMAGAIEIKTRCTEGHYHRVADLCLRIGMRLGYGAARLGMLEYGAWLHDAGKIGIPDGILHKPIPLTRAEERILREHPILGACLAASVEHLAPIAPIIRHHHERWDGLGYPDGLAGEAIPEESRIIAITNAYDGLIAPRGGKKGLTPPEAVERISELKETAFDPHLVELFLDLMQPALTEK